MRELTDCGGTKASHPPPDGLSAYRADGWRGAMPGPHECPLSAAAVAHISQRVAAMHAAGGQEPSPGQTRAGSCFAPGAEFPALLAPRRTLNTEGQGHKALENDEVSAAGSSHLTRRLTAKRY